MHRMQRRTVLQSVLLALITSSVPGGTAILSAQSPGAMTVQSLSSDTRALVGWNDTVTRMLRVDDLRLESERGESLLPGRVVQQLDQYFKGFRIWGAGVSRQLDGNQSVVSILGTIYENPAVDVSFRLDEADAVAILQGLGTIVGVRTRPALEILPIGDSLRLVWVAEIATDTDSLRVFIDANSGELVRQDELLQSQLPANAYVGHGRGVLGDDKKISTAPLSGGFVTYDTIRPPEISTFDLRGNQARSDFVQRGLLPLATSDFASTSSSNEWSDPSVVDAHVNSSYTYDYYARRLGRAGLNNRNGPVRNLVHTARRADVFLASSDEKWFLNAQYSPVSSVMYYGEGLDFVVDLGDGPQRVNYLSAALDIVAHELTHGVTAYSSGLEYRNESGALNEAFSDMMGTSVEFFIQQPGTGLLKADYLVGEDAFTAATSSGLSGIRSMENPRLFRQPDHVNSPLRVPSVAVPTAANDSGGVHTNSGIPNHAFYLAIEGGVNRTSGIRVQGVGAANRIQIERVFYHAFTDLMRSTATFSAARAATLQSAIDLYGASSSAYAAVRDAWTAVGVN